MRFGLSLYILTVALTFGFFAWGQELTTIKDNSTKSVKKVRKTKVTKAAKGKPAKEKVTDSKFAKSQVTKDKIKKNKMIKKTKDSAREVASKPESENLSIEDASDADSNQAVQPTANDYMQVNSDQDISKPEMNFDSETRRGLTLEELFIRGDITISEWFDSAAEGLDLFLIGKKVTNRKNRSTIKVENATFSSEGKEVSNSTSINANLHLPNVEDYWQLKFTSYDEREERRGASKSYLRQEPREENYGTTIGLFREIGNIRTAYQPRIEFGSSLKISQSLSFESSAKVGDFSTNPKLELYASPVKGAGIFTSLNFSTPLTEIFSFTLVNDADYGEKLHLFSVNNGFTFGQLVTSRASLSYSLIFNSQNQPNYHLNGYFISVSWNHILYKNILSYQITPHVDFFKSYGFRAAAGAFLLIDLLF